MSAHYFALVVGSLLMYAQYSCAQEASPGGTQKAAQRDSRPVQVSGEPGTDPGKSGQTSDAENDTTEMYGKNAAAYANRQSDLNGPPVPSLSEAQLAARNRSAQTSSGPDLYTRVTKEYYSQSATPVRQEKPGTLSRFGLRYSQTGNDHIWLEYRFSEKGALRLRGAAHRGVRVLAVFEY